MHRSWYRLVKNQFYYTVDLRSDPITKMLEKFNKQQKKELKDAKNKMREEKLMAILASKSSEAKPNNECVKKTETVK